MSDFAGWGILRSEDCRAGDRVRTRYPEDGDEHGTVVRDGVAGEDLCVRWDSEEYDASTVGNLVCADWLVLWPAALHHERTGVGGGS